MTALPGGTPVIGRGDLDRLARTHRLVPITRTLFADGETPVGVYRKLAAGRPGTFLLESAEPGASFSRWSFVGVDARARLSVADGSAVWTGEVPGGTPTDDDPLAALGAAWRAVKAPRLPGLPPLTGGFVGFLGYDVVRRIERLPDKAVDDLGLPELTMFLTTDLAAVDHHECTVVLIANAVLGPEMGAVEIDEAYADAVRRLDRMQAALATPAPPTVATTTAVAPKEAQSRTPAGEYQPAVEAALEAVRAGDVFQIQVGQRFVADTAADPLDVYRVLRTLNPSPYMYFLRAGEEHDPVDIVGCSPEALVSVSGDRAVLHPIAGTRRRGETAERDAALAQELVSDPKERAEHVMLVDLARNDLGRVAAPGSVEVVEFGTVERYSHVWHIVSTVEAQVATGKDAFDVLTATFPAGTLTGAPKVRAMELIDELEPVRRHVYGGAVGYLDAAGDLDMAIAIRTAVMRGGKAYVQAAAGVVADSVPANEEQETRNKARAVLQAIATAETLRTVS
ncbi:anthranilate synthase component 1 [Jatrophihabitans endophyticus]|uniref:Anthranilate synthase component 1 n=1 Tax=Jatrophihabitans endophyticus TaxID=1206085 RepID=A0A1M5LH61_9ACTN|nr:anthranilate synthase component I [Jatrophihabitans endophyticus]SHG63703.1 anthranilate synthase component 1 [Jatrophihabitans endophyticus]